MHNLRSYESDAEQAQGIIQAADLASINYLQPGKNDELFNKLKQGARTGSTILFTMTQVNDLTFTELFNHTKETIEISKNKKPKVS